MNLGYYVKMFTLFDWYLHYTNDPVHKILDCFRKFSEEMYIRTYSSNTIA